VRERANRLGIELGAETLSSPERALPLEWVLGDGAGSYASSTVIGCNTRRYHGLLVAAQTPLADRTVLLSKVEEEIWIGEKRYSLSTNEYPGVFHPSGHEHLVGFHLRPFPRWTYDFDGTLLWKEVMMLRGRRAVCVTYRLVGLDGEATLRVAPMLACRGIHQLAGPGTAFSVRPAGQAPRVTVQGGPRHLTIHVSASDGSFEEEPLRFQRMTYRRERERGFDCEEELFSPGSFVVSLRPQQLYAITAGADPSHDIDPKAERRREIQRISAHLGKLDPSNPLERTLALAADVFLVGEGAGGSQGIIAAYPWFECWGRDALISLEGLALVTGRIEEAGAVLTSFADRVAGGVVPNYLAADPAHDALNSIDAGLWFIHAVSRYLSYNGDKELVRQRLWPKVVEILESYAAGTHFDIRADGDGLLRGGSPETQLTWMDAKVHGQAVTPRYGKAVEVNALWYNALRVGAELAQHFGRSPESYARHADKVKAAFHGVFWSDECGCLYDYVAGDTVDARLRPNQILAVSLPHAVLEEDKWAAVVSVVREHLYTPYGLRTLAQSELGYRGKYAGTEEARDGAYHQGSLWPWLLGPFYEAYLKVNGFSSPALRKVRQALSVWKGHLHEAGLGNVSEVFDGDSPHIPGGCVAQAWSVAELLRICRMIEAGRSRDAKAPSVTGGEGDPG